MTEAMHAVPEPFDAVQVSVEETSDRGIIRCIVSNAINGASREIGFPYGASYQEVGEEIAAAVLCVSDVDYGNWHVALLSLWGQELAAHPLSAPSTETVRYEVMNMSDWEISDYAKRFNLA